jgi:hypothetical protein
MPKVNTCLGSDTDVGPLRAEFAQASNKVMPAPLSDMAASKLRTPLPSQLDAKGATQLDAKGATEKLR